jgi:phospho-N-acetylmuramoyl-pentapeptide-transferase
MLSYLANFDEYFGPLRVLRYITLRTLMAAGTATVIGFILGPWLIHQLRLLKFGQHYDDDRTGDLAQRFDKKNTPTMGGLLIFGCVFLSTFLVGGAQRLGGRGDVCLHGPHGRRLSGRLPQGRAQEPRRHLLGRKDLWQTLITLVALAVLLWHPLSAQKIRELWVPFVKYPVMAVCLAGFGCSRFSS